MDINYIILISTIVTPILANIIQETFRFLSKCKRSRCCGTDIEYGDERKRSFIRPSSNINLQQQNKE